MPIPAFTSAGVLPPTAPNDPASADRSPYFVSMSELVTSLGTTDHRKGLLRNLIAYRGLLIAEGYSGIQFIDGSFVEDIEAHGNRPPGDIDVYSLLRVPAKYLQDQAAWQQHGFPFWAKEVANQSGNKARFQLDTYAQLVEELDLMGLLQNTMYWYGLFSHQRDTFRWKGFIGVTLDAQQDADALALLGGI